MKDIGIQPRPCPFCGKAPSVETTELADEPDNGWRVVQCKTWGCVGPIAADQSAALAIRKWNTRRGVDRGCE